jgi:hypothetical protein
MKKHEISSPPKTNFLPEINLNIETDEIVAKTRKLKAVWTTEMAQDIGYLPGNAEEKLQPLPKKNNQFRSIDDDWEISSDG